MKNKIKIMTLIFILLININVFAFEKYDTKRYEIKTVITLQGEYPVPNCANTKHYIQTNFNSPNFAFDKILLDDKDLKYIIFNNNLLTLFSEVFRFR